jgi:flavin-dependent dehydrogenase
MSTPDTTYDVGIVGGGLAGLTLALQLSRKGHSVVLFEKESYPFHRVCGEYISMESAAFLKDCGIDYEQLKLPRITQLKVTAPSGFGITHPLNPGGIGISRYMLDDLLVKEARSTGVTVLENSTITQISEVDNHYELVTQAATYQARIVAGTWGKRSAMDVKWKRPFINESNRRLSRYIGIKYHLKADLPHDMIELHNFKDGYCGISKIEDDRYCMCYLTTADNLKQAGGDIKEMEEQILQRNPYLNDYFNRFPSLYEKPLAISQISFEPKEIFLNEVPFAGDAAGLITPLCGNGMSMAMHAAKILSFHIHQYLKGDKASKAEFISAYEAEWQQNFSSRLRAGRFIQSMFGKPIITEVVLRILKPFPLFVGKLVNSTHGQAF